MQEFLGLVVNLIKDVSVIMVLAYGLSRTELFSSLLDRKLSWSQRTSVILIFGLFSIFGTLGGVHFPSGIANVRDLGPVIAGFLAGPVAGLGAALIGAAHRFSLGGPVALGGSLGTLLTGFAAGLVWVYRQGRFPGVILASVCMFFLACFHIGLNYVIGWSNPEVIKLLDNIGIPMIIANTLGMAIFAVILNNLINERKTEAAKEKIEGELKVARTIQMSLVPKIFPAFPEREEIDLYALLEPAREVGGDMYDFYLSLDDRLYFTVGDVSGKGVPASLFMAVTRTLLRARATELLQPEIILMLVNRELCRDNDSGMFVTQFLGILDIHSGEVLYSNAGHNLPFILRSNGEVEMLPRLPGMAMGVLEEVEYQQGRLYLAPGDCLLVYTDGVTEALNPDYELYNEARLTDALTQNIGHSSRDICNSILDGVRDFAAGEEQADDITVLALTYTGKQQFVRIELKNDISEIETMSRGLERFGSLYGLPEKQIFQLNLALEELVTNSISYGFGDDLEHLIVIDCMVDDGRIKVVTKDDGLPFNPLTMPEPETDLDIEDRPIGGLGIHLVRKMMDSVDYQRQGDFNLLTMIKKID